MRPHHGPRTGAAIVAALAAASAALTACSDSGSGSGAPDNELGHALSLVHSQGTKTTVDFGQPAAALAANGGIPGGSGPYSRIAGYGEGNLAGYAPLLPKVLGFAPDTAEYAVTTGQLPKSGTLLSGVDTGQVASHARTLGATVDGSTYRFRPDYRASSSDKLGTALADGLSVGVNVISAKDRDVRAASASAGLDLTSGGGDNLASADPFAAVAGCLDDPLAAQLSSTLPPPEVRPASGTTRTTGIAAVGVGVSGKKGATPVDHLCVAADSDDHASAIANSIRAALKNGSSVEANEKWSWLLKDSKVTVSGQTVSLIATSSNGVGGVMLQFFQHGDLPGLSG